MLVSQLRLRGDTIQCKHICLPQTREQGAVEAVEQVEEVEQVKEVEEERVMTREEDLFSLIDSKSFTSSGDEGGSPYCVLVEEEVEVVEVVVVGLGVVMGTLLGVLVVVATRIGILEL